MDENFEVVFWPIAFDGKVKDVEALPDGAITLMLVNGGIRTSENEEMAKLLRRKSKILVAFGSCATEGCIPGMANFSSQEDIFKAAYDTPSTNNPDGVWPQPKFQMPEGEIHIPEFYPALRTLEQVVPGGLLRTRLPTGIPSDCRHHRSGNRCAQGECKLTSRLVQPLELEILLFVMSVHVLEMLSRSKASNASRKLNTSIRSCVCWSREFHAMDLPPAAGVPLAAQLLARNVLGATVRQKG